MKILVGAFQCESNTFSAAKAGKENFYILHGDEAKDKLFASHLFEEAGFEVVPLVYAVSLPSGMVTRECFDEVMSDFRAEAAKHPDAAGVYLYLHGAMYVEEWKSEKVEEGKSGRGEEWKCGEVDWPETGFSGEEWTVRELRKTVGDTIPITLALDFHGNLSDGLVPLVQGIAGYRTAPHTDYDDTERRAAVALLKLLAPQGSSTLYTSTRPKKTPLIIPHFFRINVQFADAAQTSVEPYVSVLRMIRELDADPRVVTASVFNGQPWVDAPFMSASVIVYSSANHDEIHAKAKAIADYFDAHKTDLTFGVPAVAPDDVVEAVRAMAKPVFVSDSGDNTTAGAAGESDVLVKVFCGTGLKTLFTSLYDPDAVAKYANMVGRVVPNAPSVVCRGRILGFVGEEAGEGVVVRDGNIDIVYSTVRTSFTMKEHFAAMGLNPADYDVVVVKQGYLWPGAAELAASQVFCLTPGTATNDFSTLPFKNLVGDYYYVKPTSGWIGKHDMIGRNGFQ